MKRRYNCKQLYKEISRRDKVVFVTVLLLVFSVFQLGIKQICGFTIYPDEFGYWASAAKIIGWDWSEVASLGSYYSFGYSIWLFPILYFAPNSVMAYQTAIFINMLFMCLGYCFLCMITEKLFGNMPRTLRYLISGTAVLYPAWIFYMQMTMAEALLMTLFIVVIYLFIVFIENPGMLTGILLVAVLFYFYIVHMRTVGTMLACGITLFLWGIVKPHCRKYVFGILCLTIIAFIGAFYIKEWVQQSVYMLASAEKLAGNDYAGEIKNIRYVFTTDGFRSLMSHLAGKVIYWGVASLGLVYWAFAWMLCQIRSLVKKIRNGKDGITSEWFAVFLLLISLAQITVSSLFYIRSKKLDFYMNGRYIDFLVPVLILTGVYHLYKSDCRWRKTVMFGLIHIGLAFVTAVTIWKDELQRIRGYHQIGTIWLLNNNEVNTIKYLTTIASVGVLFLLLVAFFVWLIRKKEVFIWSLALLMFIEIGIGLIASIRYCYSSNNLNYRGLVFLDIVEEKCIPDAEIYYMDDGSDQWIDFIQMQLREQSIKVVTEETLQQNSADIDILFTVNTETNMEKYSSQFDKCVEQSLLILFYNTEDEGGEI